MGLGRKQLMRKYTFNATWLVFEKTVRIIATTLVAFYIARYLGPQDFGQLSYALAWLAIFGSLCSLGLDSIVLREISYLRSGKTIFSVPPLA